MAFLSSLDISLSGMTAQRLRMDIISQNVANADTYMTEDGEAYRRQMVVFQESKSFRNVLAKKVNDSKLKNYDLIKYKGVVVKEVVEDETPLTPVYDPSNPHADEMGYIYKPNVDPATEELDSLEATRSYEANLAVYTAVKEMTKKALSIGS